MMFMLGEYIAIILMYAMTTILFLGGWLPPFDFAPFTWVPGIDLVRAQGAGRLLHVRDGQGLRPALPLRPADAARLEGLPADLAGDGGRRGRPFSRSPAGAGTGGAVARPDRHGHLPDASSSSAPSSCRCATSSGRKKTINYPSEKGADSARASVASMRSRRYPNGEERCIACKLVRGDLPGAGDHHRGRPAPQRRHRGARPATTSTW